MKREHFIDAAACVLLVVLTFVLYRKILRLWWTWDDAYLLHIAAGYTARDHFFGSTIWLSMPQQLFTPLLTASYDAELTLFGADPHRFYMIHLAELSLTVVALYATLRFWMSRAAASCASVLFVSGTPLCTMATQLMLMHYVLSVLLGVVSVALFTLSVRRRQDLLSIASAIIYLAAMLAKEVAVPLPLVLLLLPENGLRGRVRRVWPHALVLAVFIAWRSLILRKLIGGYAPFSIAEFALIAARTPFSIVRTFAGPAVAAGFVLVLLLAVGIIARLRSWRDATAVALAFAAAILPILPAARWQEKRFSYVSWMCAAIVFASGIESLRNRRVAVILMTAAPLLSIVVNRQAWSREFGAALRMSDEGRVFTDLGPGDALRKPLIPPPSMFELEWLKESVLHRAAGSWWFFDDLYLCRGERPRRTFGYDSSSRTVREITSQIDAIARNYCASIRDNQPLTAHFRYHNEVLYWDLGPYDRGEYGVVIGNGFQSFDVSRRDALRLIGLKSLTMRVRYRAPQGWVTYSPELTIELQGEHDLAWRRGAA